MGKKGERGGMAQKRKRTGTSAMSRTNATREKHPNAEFVAHVIPSQITEA
jgi:hypothetical protein